MSITNFFYREEKLIIDKQLFWCRTKGQVQNPNDFMARNPRVIFSIFFVSFFVS
jgi:hypothetical protein